MVRRGEKTVHLIFSLFAELLKANTVLCCVCDHLFSLQFFSFHLQLCASKLIRANHYLPLSLLSSAYHSELFTAYSHYRQSWKHITFFSHSFVLPFNLDHISLFSLCLLRRKIQQNLFFSGQPTDNTRRLDWAVPFRSILRATSFSAIGDHFCRRQDCRTTSCLTHTLLGDTLSYSLCEQRIFMQQRKHLLHSHSPTLSLPHRGQQQQCPIGTLH